jgi:hypothetical protein
MALKRSIRIGCLYRQFFSIFLKTFYSRVGFQYLPCQLWCGVCHTGVEVKKLFFVVTDIELG